MELQERWAGVPSGRALVESFPEGAGRAVVFHAFLGRRANEALARALEQRTHFRACVHDWGFALRAPRAWKPTRTKLLRLLQDPLGPTLTHALEGSELFRRRFRHVATRALVIRRREGEGVGMRQRHADRLLREYPSDHVLIREAIEECLHEAMDLDTAEAWRASVASGERPLALVDDRPCASPLAARILAPYGESRHAALRDHRDAIAMYDSMLSH